MPISCPVLWIANHFRAVRRHEARTDEERQAGFFCRDMGAHDTGKRIMVCNTDGDMPQLFGGQDEFFCM